MNKNLAPADTGHHDIVISVFYISWQMIKATIDGKRIKLTAKEFDLLYLLMGNREETFSRNELKEKSINNQHL